MNIKRVNHTWYDDDPEVPSYETINLYYDKEKIYYQVYDLVNEEYLYSSSLNKREAIERLQKEIAERRILPAEDYINKYGTFKPNW